MYIDRIFELDELLNYEKFVAEAKGIDITNISYWNASHQYQEYMIKYIKLEHTKDIFNYKYTYDIPLYIRNEIIKKLIGYTNKEIMCLLTSSSTCSIVNIINFIKYNGFHKLCIITPAYFSVEQNCKIFQLQYEKKSLIFCDGKYYIPLEYILNNSFDVVWITSPIYSTSQEYDVSQIQAIKELIYNHILVIADETLAMPGQELARILPINNYFYSIYSPHKPLFINSIKFSAIVCPKRNDDFLEQWIDVLGGGLLHSNISAIMHFLSANYQSCYQHSLEWYLKNITAIESILNQFPNAFCNTMDVGAYKTVYFHPNKNEPDKIETIKHLISSKYVSYIPGSFNGFNEDEYNCFRINLSLDFQETKNLLYRILSYYA